MPHAARPSPCLLLVALVALGSAAPRLARAQGNAPDAWVRLVADRDDDDGNREPDAEQPAVSHRSDLLCLDPPSRSPRAKPGVAIPAGAPVRLLVDGMAWRLAERLPARFRALCIQATGPGRTSIRAGERQIEVAAVAVMAVDREGRGVDLARSHASLSRTPPERLEPGQSPAALADGDALRYVLVGVADDLPARVRLETWSPEGDKSAELGPLRLTPGPCPPGVTASLSCASTEPIRITAEEIDASHPIAARRSIMGEVGGAMVITDDEGRKLQMIRIGGPRVGAGSTPARLRARLRALLVRAQPQGAPPIGQDDAGALGAARDALARTQALWGACGIGFGPAAASPVQLVDPPPSHLLEVGCGLGLPASGGRVRFRVDGRPVEVAVARGQRPAEAARRIAGALRELGLSVRISDNARLGRAAFASTDLSVRQRGGRLASIEPPADGGAVSVDATLGVCIGAVDLSDGLQHFGELDAEVGTLEERTLVRALDDGDPATIDVVVVPSFGGGDRIGEAFIGTRAGAPRNTVIVDRAGLRAGPGAFALPHELGHVLLADPGHPDDYGIDTPTRLMDADADEPSAFGPSRLTVEECARIVVQNGPGAQTPLLLPWPWGPFEPRGASWTAGWKL